MTTEQIDAVVIGAGVVGLACARALTARGIETLIIERHERIGQEISSRNSEVIHAGLYYPPGSHKARLCVQGNKALYDYCTQRGIPHQRCGKLIVATVPAQIDKLALLLNQARDNGVSDIRMITGAEAFALEPHLSCTAALLSPSTGIIDSNALMLSLLADAEHNGATLVLRSGVSKGKVTSGGIILQINNGDETIALKAKIVINAAGLSAPGIASSITGLPTQHIPTAYYAKGNYFSLSGRTPFSRLIYPIPEPGGLGVHLTLDLGGQARFGPDVEWVDDIDYSVSPERADGFYDEVRKYWRGLPDDALQPAYCGIRPKITSPNATNADFLIQGRGTHGVPGLINLFGIESPGLTSCLSIAEHICTMLGVASG
jgi:L-2-hydroxyglutarate oxidase LhgO